MTNKIPHQDKINQVLEVSAHDLIKAEMDTPGLLPQRQEAASVDARKCVNAMKTIGEALVVSAMAENQQEVFVATLEKSGELARKILISWGVNPDDKHQKWMSNVVEKSVIPYVSSFSQSEDLIFKVAQALKNREHEWVNQNVEPLCLINATFLRGTLGLMRAQNEFDFWRKERDQDIYMLQDLIVNSAVSLLPELVHSLTPPNERGLVFNTLLDMGFEFAETAWRKTVIKAHPSISSLTKPQIIAWKKANPEGFSLDPVVTLLEQNLQRFSRLTLSARKLDKKLNR